MFTKPINRIGIILAVTSLFLFGFFSLDAHTFYNEAEEGYPRRPHEMAMMSDSQDKPEYAPVEVIIKLKDEATKELLAKEDLSSDLNSQQDLFSRVDTESLNTLLNVQTIDSLEPVLKGRWQKVKELLGTNSSLTLEEIEEALDNDIRSKFPKRALTAPADTSPLSLSNIFLLKFKDKDTDIISFCQELQKDPNVLYAEPNYKRILYITPQDTYYPEMWNLHNTGEENQYPVPGGERASGTEDADIDASEAWGIPDSVHGEGVIVAVLDTGIDYTHPDIDDNLWVNPGEIAGDGIDNDGNGFIDDIYGADPSDDDGDPSDYVGHGTHVSGTIAAEANSEGVIGIAFNAEIMTVKIFPNAYDDVILRAFEYAANHSAQVINNSWGSIYPDMHSQVISDGINYAYNHGAVVVFSAGNNYSSDAARYFSGTLDVLDKVILVAGTNSQDKKASFSNYGPDIDVAAPGVDILSLRAYMYEACIYPFDDPDAQYYIASGTSMSCPHACGVAALVISNHSHYSNESVKQILRHSADDIGTPGWDESFGHGRINAYKALITIPQSNIIFYKYTINDSSEDGQVNPGETINLTISLKNTWLDAGNVSTLLSTDDPHVDIIDSTVFFGDIHSGSVIESSVPYVFNVDLSSSTGRLVTFRLDIEADGGYSHPETFTIPISISLQSGWPKTMDAPAVGSPALIDIDRDRIPEVVVASENRVYAWKGDGRGLLELDGSFALPDKQEILIASPAMGDIDGDGDVEIVVGSSNGKVYAWHHNGDRVDGWPVTIMTISDPIIEFVFSEITLEDIDNDGTWEVLFEGAIAYEGEDEEWFPMTYTKVEVYALKGNGNIIWSDIIWDDEGYVRGLSLSVGDINGDGEKEIAVNIDNKTTIYHHDGEIMANWPVINQHPSRPENYAVFNLSPVLGDIDGGSLEIVVPSSYDNTTGIIGNNFSKICIWHSDTTEVNGWPVTESTMTRMMEVYPPIRDVVLGDIDGDGYVEVIAGGIDGLIYAWEHDGAQIVTSYSINSTYWPAWPAYPEWTVPLTFRYFDGLSLPVLGDIDSDGDIEIVAGTSSGKVCAIHHDGSPVGTWPIEIEIDDSIDDSLIYSARPPSIALGDIDGDRDIEVIVVSSPFPTFVFPGGKELKIPGEVYVWDCSGVYNPGNIEWGQFRHNAQHTGCYASPTDLTITNLFFSNPTPKRHDTVEVTAMITNTGGAPIDSFKLHWYIDGIFKKEDVRTNIPGFGLGVSIPVEYDDHPDPYIEGWYIDSNVGCIEIEAKIVSINGEDVTRDNTKTAKIFVDLDDNGRIDIADIMQVAARWSSRINDGSGRYDPLYDIDNDQDIDIVDIMRVVSKWGQTEENCR